MTAFADLTPSFLVPPIRFKQSSKESEYEQEYSNELQDFAGAAVKIGEATGVFGKLHIFAIQREHRFHARFSLGRFEKLRKTGFDHFQRDVDANGGAGRRSGAEAALALLVRSDRSEEIDFSEGRPVDVAEVELAVGALPE